MLEFGLSLTLLVIKRSEEPRARRSWASDRKDPMVGFFFPWPGEVLSDRPLCRLRSMNEAETGDTTPLAAGSSIRGPFEVRATPNAGYKSPFAG